MIRWLAVLFIAICFESCEGYRCANGTVLDKTTNLPLDSVLIEIISADSRAVYTDTTGTFDVCNNFGGCMPCKDIILKFSKNNYNTIILTNPEKDERVIMDK